MNCRRWRMDLRSSAMDRLDQIRLSTPMTTNSNMNMNTSDIRPVLVLGGTGKTGRRVAQRLRARGTPVRIGSRSARPAFDWEDDSTWSLAVDGVRAA